MNNSPHKNSSLKSSGKFDSEKRRTLKTLAGITSSAVIAGIPVSAIGSTALPSYKSSGDVLNCTLISRADVSRAHLLMHNKTDIHITASTFMQQLIEFDNTLLDLKSAYTQTVVIPPNDKVMVRLNVEDGLNKKTPYQNVMNLNDRIMYLPQGTRIVEIKVRSIDGVCIIDNIPVPT